MRIHEFGNPDAPVVLIEPIHTVEGMAHEAELLRELSALIRENGVGALAFDREKKTVTLTYSAAYTAFLDRLGGDVPALDLDLLYDAYRLQYVARGLEEAGFDAGYLTTASGLSLVLSGGSAAEYCLYAQKNGETLVAATLRGEPGTAASLFRVFPLYGEEEGYYRFLCAAKPFRRPERGAGGTHPGRRLSEHPSLFCERGGAFLPHVRRRQRRDPPLRPSDRPLGGGGGADRQHAGRLHRQKALKKTTGSPVVFFLFPHIMVRKAV